MDIYDMKNSVLRLVNFHRNCSDELKKNLDKGTMSNKSINEWCFGYRNEALKECNLYKREVYTELGKQAVTGVKAVNHDTGIASVEVWKDHIEVIEYIDRAYQAIKEMYRQIDDLIPDEDKAIIVRYS